MQRVVVVLMLLLDVGIARFLCAREDKKSKSIFLVGFLCSLMGFIFTLVQDLGALPFYFLAFMFCDVMTSFEIKKKLREFLNDWALIMNFAAIICCSTL